MTEPATAEDVDAVIGEATTVTAVTPSASEQRSDAKGRIGNTATQATIAGALVSIGAYFCNQAGIDLDKLTESVELPIPISNAFVVVLTILVAWWMNRAGLTAKDE